MALRSGKRQLHVVRGDDSRDVIQMRVDMGLLQMETRDAPTGSGRRVSSLFDYLVSQRFATTSLR